MHHRGGYIALYLSAPELPELHGLSHVVNVVQPAETVGRERYARTRVARDRDGENKPGLGRLTKVGRKPAPNRNLRWPYWLGKQARILQYPLASRFLPPYCACLKILRQLRRGADIPLKRSDPASATTKARILQVSQRWTFRSLRCHPRSLSPHFVRRSQSWNKRSQ